MLRKLFKFHGGVKPQTNKTGSTTAPIAQVPLPDRLVIPLHQAVGGHPRPLVQVGDHVFKGQRIGGDQQPEHDLHAAGRVRGGWWRRDKTAVHVQPAKGPGIP